jgi:hypothetical protein
MTVIWSRASGDEYIPAAVAVPAVLSAQRTTQPSALPKVKPDFGGVAPHVAIVGRFLKARFALKEVGGKAPRSNPRSDHPNGLALDLMVGKDTKKGSLIESCVRKHMKQWGVTYTIWAKPDHYDHVHVSFLPTATPTDLEC